jgi:hypothetical protein
MEDWSKIKPDANEQGLQIAKSWLSKRGLDWSFLEEKLHIRAVYVGRDYGGAGVAIPMFGIPREDEIIRICRPISNIRYLNPPNKKIEELFNEQSLDNNNNPVIITEGITDALTMIQIKPAAVEVVAIPGTLHAVNQDLFKKLTGRVVLTAMDNDTPGKKASNDLRNSLLSVGVEAVQEIAIPEHYGDVNDWFLASGEQDILTEIMLSYAKALQGKKTYDNENHYERTPNVIFMR